ncbi:gamma-glutamylcyclotransferase family protein [Anaerotruncus colihominis]|uniref:AIG2-like family protein n=1 Tax=Anaerotruncus colihominis DSM 17241 TaxID=445972 RepID=B0PC07_9FIRM|nr:gamma-glutamylcyclotransferase family protein [Anaerotruncus colihominis]EDS11132.1 AIG2-like family protein [Anaerotruncus colihominis DSM 17241]OUO66149.1 gamma-glutamylcyclotransferase [Anaerotruncus colihominis]
MEKRLYVAYGRNLNILQMKQRCPTAKLCGTGTVENYQLQFKGRPQSAFATISPKEGSSVPVAVWELQPRDERALDRYEGYPSHYFKQDIPVQLDGKEVVGMAYIMDLEMDHGLPSLAYYQTVQEGYEDCGLDVSVLERAVLDSAKPYFAEGIRQSYQQSLFSEGDSGEEFEGEEEDMDEPDLSGSFGFSDGIRL